MSRFDAVAQLAVFAGAVLDRVHPIRTAVIPYRALSFDDQLEFGVVPRDVAIKVIVQQMETPFESEALQQARVIWATPGVSFWATDLRDYSWPDGKLHSPCLRLLTALPRSEVLQLASENGLMITTERGSRYFSNWFLESTRTAIEVYPTLASDAWCVLDSPDFPGSEVGGVLGQVVWLARLLSKRIVACGLSLSHYRTRPVEAYGLGLPAGKAIDWSVEAAMSGPRADEVPGSDEWWSRLEMVDSRYAAVVNASIDPSSVSTPGMPEKNESQSLEKLGERIVCGFRMEVWIRKVTPLEADEPGAPDYTRLPWTSTILRVTGTTKAWR